MALTQPDLGSGQGLWEGWAQALGVLQGVLLPFSGPWLEQNPPILTFCPHTCNLIPRQGREQAVQEDKLPSGEIILAKLADERYIHNG